MDWLETFVVAAEEENFHRVAQRLHLSQPTITMQIQKLESIFGGKLFERNGRGVMLTPAAKKLLPFAMQMLAAFDQSREAMARWRQGYEVSITIAVSPLVATTWLPRWIQAYTRDRPDVEFSIQVYESQDIESKIVSGECDVGFTRTEVHHPLVYCDLLYSDPVILVVPNTPLDAGKTVEPNTPLGAGSALHAGGSQCWHAGKTAWDYLAEYPLFTHNHPEYWDGLLHDVQTVSPRPLLRTMRVSQVLVTLHMIVEHMGVSFLPMSTACREMQRGTVLEAPISDLILPTARTCIVHHRHAFDEVVRFAGFVREFMDSGGANGGARMPTDWVDAGETFGSGWN